MLVIIFAMALVYSGLKWLFWNMTCKAVLLYFAELGNEIPDSETIKKYRTKVIEKTLTVKES